MDDAIARFTMNRIIKETRGLTLIEVLVCLVAITTVFAMIIPALQAGKQYSKSEICLSNLKELTAAIRIYAEDNNNQLPGPLTAAINHHQTIASYASSGPPSPEELEYYLGRQLSYRLRPIMGDDVDRAIICPTIAGIAPDSHFHDFNSQNGRSIFPFNYTLNNWGNNGMGGSGFVALPRVTDPRFYFGNQPYPGSPDLPIQPQVIGNFNNPSKEWMIADAWYRDHATPISELQQDGPYQSGWSGEALPYFAPHFKRGSTKMYTDPGERKAAAYRTHETKSDGLTNTLFFDGHAAAVPSRTFVVNGFKLISGFPGTANPKLTEQSQMFWDVGTWE